MNGDVVRVRRLLGGEGLAWVVDRARNRWERGQELGSTLRLADPTPLQRESLAALLGRPPRGAGALSVRVEELEGVLRSAGAAHDLRSAVEALSGPVVDGRALRTIQEQRWDSAFGVLDDAATQRPRLRAWATRLRADGLLRRLAADPEDAHHLALAAVRVIDELPRPTPELRARLAGRVLDDAHALDDGRPVATLVLRAASDLADEPVDVDLAVAGARGRRRTWASVGVEVGDLSAPVLTLGLPGEGTSATGRVLSAWRDAGQPVHLSGRQLLLDPPSWALDGTLVSVCENPSVVSAAADLFGSGCTPLVCTYGQPSAAVATLLDQLVAAGARLRYHGDFDWGGLRIATTVVSRWAAHPWRYGADDYRLAVAAGRAGRGLGDRSGPSSWDPALSTAMAEIGRLVEEEAVVDDLLADLTS